MKGGIKWAVWDIVGFVKFRGKWVPRHSLVKALLVCADIEFIKEANEALYGKDKTKNK